MSGHVGSTQKSKFLFQEVMTNFHNTYLRLLLLELVEKQIFLNKIQLYYITILAIPISCTSDRREIHFRQHISEFECFMDAIIFRDQVMEFWSAPLYIHKRSGSKSLDLGRWDAIISFFLYPLY